ncbi:TonB-dependent receptor domain-containing protein [Aliarcobacter cibarius]|uniref:TonB-dependent receptor domain-containing protein n=1 Tax=Aliarcobacter cibarius TaxID=255507 RepID=UPI0010FE54D2|nr:TonB-dependent receptor [Aliarcobacter cibarius]QEZ90254.1 TonB-dependent receptor [Aliarcobacter cibarius]TLT02367.1 TonB-dependent receptor [Aliarcobacter cibarius]
MRIKMAVSAATLILTQNLILANETTKLDDVQVVTSASGYEQKITDAPASISVITQEDLQKKPYNNLLDAVKDIEGVDIGETTDKTNNGQISIRGMGADYTLVLIDGKKQNNNGDIYPNNFGGAQLASIPPLSMIERIEVIRGPMSTLYGSDAIGGVINVITKKISNEWTGAIGYSKTFQTDNAYGNNDNTDFTIMGPLIKDKLGLSLRGSFYDQAKSNPQYGKVYDKNGVDRSKSNDSFGGGKGNVQNENWTFGTGLTFTPNENHTIKADFDVAKQKFDNKPYLNSQGDTSYPLGTGDSLETIYKNQRVGYADTLRMQREQYSLFWEANWNVGKSTIGVHHVESENIGRSMPLTADERKQIKANKANNNKLPGYTADWSKLSKAMLDPDFLAFMPRDARTLESTNTTYSAKYEVPLNTHYLVVGTEYLDAQMKDGVFGMDKGQTNDKKEYYQYALFAEDNWNIIDPLTFTLGARYDKHENFGDNVSPRAYLTYAIDESWTVKGGVATGYKTPKTSDLQEGITGFGGQGTNPWVGNPDLKPEKSVSKEVAVYYDHPDKHNFNVTLFQNNFKDKIDSVNVSENQLAGSDYDGIATSYSQKQNVGRAEILGLELAGKYFILENLSLKGNWTWMDSEVKSDDWKEDGKPLSTSPKHMYSTTLDWQTTSKFNTYLQYSGEIDRFNTRYQKDGKNKDLFYKNYSIWNMGASYKFTKDFTLTGRVNNLFDKDYLEYSYDDTVGSTNYYNEYNNKTAGRNFWLSARYTF